MNMIRRAQNSGVVKESGRHYIVRDPVEILLSYKFIQRNIKRVSGRAESTAERYPLRIERCTKCCDRGLKIVQIGIHYFFSSRIPVFAQIQNSLGVRVFIAQDLSAVSCYAACRQVDIHASALTAVTG